MKSQIKTRRKKGGSLQPAAERIISIYVKEVLTELNKITYGLINNIAFALKKHKSLLLLFNILKNRGIISNQIKRMLDKVLSQNGYNNMKNSVKNFLSNKEAIVQIINTIHDDQCIMNIIEDIIIANLNNPSSFNSSSDCAIRRRGGSGKKMRGGSYPINAIDDVFITTIQTIITTILIEIDKHINFIYIINNTAQNSEMNAMLMYIKPHVINNIKIKITPIIKKYESVVKTLLELFKYDAKNDVMPYFKLLDTIQEKFPNEIENIITRKLLSDDQEMENTSPPRQTNQSFIPSAITQGFNAFTLAIWNGLTLHSIYKIMKKARKEIQFINNQMNI